MNRGERRARTERVVNRRLRCAAAWWRKTPGKLKKRPPVCYCAMCRMARKGGSRKSGGGAMRPKRVATGTFRVSEADMDRKLEVEFKKIWRHRASVIWNEVGTGVILALWFGVPVIGNAWRMGREWIPAHQGRSVRGGTTFWGPGWFWDWDQAEIGAVFGLIGAVMCGVAFVGFCVALESFRTGPFARIKAHWNPQSLQRLQEKNDAK